MAADGHGRIRNQLRQRNGTKRLYTSADYQQGFNNLVAVRVFFDAGPDLTGVSIMKTLKELRESLATAAKASQAVIDVAKNDNQRSLTDEERSTIDGHLDEINKINAQIKEREGDEARQKTISDSLATTAGRQTSADLPEDRGTGANHTTAVIQHGGGQQFPMPTRARRCTALRAFKTENEAYAFGQWALGALFGNRSGQEYCRENGIAIVKGTEERAQTEGVNTAGGFLVPHQFETTLIDLREQHGVFRRKARVVPMTSDTLSVPRRTGGLTTFWIGENTAITESQKGWDRVNLTAGKVGTLTKYSSELNEDSIINLAENLASEIAFAFSLEEDTVGFNGTGISTSGGITGITVKIDDGNHTAGIVTQGTGSTFGAIVLGDFNDVVGKLPTFAEAGAEWYCSKAFFGGVMQKLIYAAGGNTVDHLTNKTGISFLGYPVNIVQVMQKVTATDTIVCLFGDLRQAAMFGDRRQTQIALSEHLNFAEDEIAIRGTQRFDIVSHDLGDTNDPGPIVALKTGT